MSALFPVDESGNNKLKSFQTRNKGLKFPAIPLKHLPSYVYCPDDVELEYPCNDKSKDTVDFSEWSYFKRQYPAHYSEKRGRWAKKKHEKGPSTQGKIAMASSVGKQSRAETETEVRKIVSRKSCLGWNPKLLRKMREPLKTDRQYLAQLAGKNKKIPNPRKTRAQCLMEQLHPIHERDSDMMFSMSASTESHVPRPRTPPEKISEEELHRRLVEQQEIEFQAGLVAIKASSHAATDPVYDQIDTIVEAFEDVVVESS